MVTVNGTLSLNNDLEIASLQGQSVCRCIESPVNSQRLWSRHERIGLRGVDLRCASGLTSFGEIQIVVMLRVHIICLVELLRERFNTANRYINFISLSNIEQLGQLRMLC